MRDAKDGGGCNAPAVPNSTPERQCVHFPPIQTVIPKIKMVAEAAPRRRAEAAGGGGGRRRRAEAAGGGGGRSDLLLVME